MDDKIERVVHSVLAAVDARLAKVRHEVERLAQHVAQRDAELSRQLAEFDQRIERHASDPRMQPTGTDPLAARMEQATQVLLERIEAMHQRTTIATNERFANVHATIDQLREGHLAGVAVPQPLPGLEAMSAPLRLGPITAQQLAVAPAASVLSPTRESPVAPAEETPAARDPHSETIDLGRLADLLSERLGHFDLPTQPG